MSTLSLQTVELSTSESTAPLNGHPSSADYNEYQRSVLIDLASLADFINDTVIVLLESIESTALTDNIGIMGSTVYSDTTDTTDVFYDSVEGESLVIADSLRVLRALIAQMQTTITNLSVEVAALEGQASNINQDSIAASLASLVSQNASLTLTVSSLSSQINALQAAAANLEGSIASTGNIPPQTTTQVPVNLTTAYPDNNYTVSLSLQDGTGYLHLLSFSYQPNGVGIFALVRNSSETETVSGNVHAITKYF